MTALHLHPVQRAAHHRRHDAIYALGDATQWVLASVREWRQRRHSRAELAALDARTLADIGLSRGEAEFLVNQPFWRE